MYYILNWCLYTILSSVLEQYPRMYCDYQQTDWASLLPLAEFSYNNSKHSATTLTPFFANCGFHPRMSLLPPSPSSTTSAADSYVQRLREAQEIMRRELLKARKAMEISANRPTSPKPDPRPESVAQASQHLHDAILIQIGCSSTRTLRCDWPHRYISRSPGSTPFHAHPSGIPCQPPGTACGEHVPGSHRGPPSSNPGGWSS